MGVRLKRGLLHRAYVKAIVSLPQETFFSSGASVKASLLFLQKFTEEEKVRFDDVKERVSLEVRSKYAREIEARTDQFNAQIRKAQQTKDARKRQSVQKELAEYRKAMSEKIQVESRARLKEEFPYYTFLYDATRVGITATGEEDLNELYPQKNKVSLESETTCLELYKEFLDDPTPFLLDQGL